MYACCFTSVYAAFLDPSRFLSKLKMASSEEVLVLEVEEVSDAVVDLLISFGLSEEIVNVFLGKKFILHLAVR